MPPLATLSGSIDPLTACTPTTQTKVSSRTMSTSCRCRRPRDSATGRGGPSASGPRAAALALIGAALRRPASSRVEVGDQPANGLPGRADGTASRTT